MTWNDKLVAGSTPNHMHLVSTISSEPFARALAAQLGVPLCAIERRHFPDGESYLRYEIDDPFVLLGKDVIVVGSTDTCASLDELYRLGFAATQNGARSLVLAIPYFGYSTMERAVRPGEQVAAKSIARQLSSLPQAARGTWVLMVDLHTPGLVHYFEGPSIPLEVFAMPLLIETIRRLDLPRLTLASTDMGRAKQVERYANQLHAPVALIHKRRLSGSKTQIGGVLGEVTGRDVVIYDDMIRTGGSLVQAAEAYRDAGATSVTAVTTHLVLPPGTVERLEASPLTRVIGTDTHPNHALVLGRPRFEVVSVAGLVADVIRRLVASP